MTRNVDTDLPAPMDKVTVVMRPGKQGQRLQFMAEERLPQSEAPPKNNIFGGNG